jgi:hypothetical protein
MTLWSTEYPLHNITNSILPPYWLISYGKGMDWEIREDLLFIVLILYDDGYLYSISIIGSIIPIISHVVTKLTGWYDRCRRHSWSRSHERGRTIFNCVIPYNRMIHWWLGRSSCRCICHCGGCVRHYSEVTLPAATGDDIAFTMKGVLVVRNVLLLLYQPQ